MLNLMRHLLFFLFSTYSFQVLAGPFGLEQGMSLEQMNKITKIEETDDEFIYGTKTLPQGSNEIDIYRFVITPTEGLCRIFVST